MEEKEIVECKCAADSQKRMHTNIIRFNCTAFDRISPLHPAYCYNCMVRDGYPQNLGGDWYCVNFKQIN